ncbi:hypothetical protein EV178_003618 [Coemansia sp. RSA 1646]|nr:hypothetical protein EV178_003618 [Coemansia sp. RSA 1646]
MLPPPEQSPQIRYLQKPHYVQQQQPKANTRAILPNRAIEVSSEGNVYVDALLRKRERNKLAARRKRDRKKKRLEALEKREKDLLNRRQVLEAEIRVYREQAAVAREQEYHLTSDVEEEIANLREAVDTACNQTKEVICILEAMQMQLRALLERIV